MSTGFSDRQLKKLATPLDRARVQTREFDGKTLSYIEGWFAISEANRIFGYDGWDREMMQFERLFERKRSDATHCAYLARVRIRVRANSATILREGTGFGQATAGFAGEAHERALKAAETDATKRALATFGGRFGLLLYDKDRSDSATSAGDAAGRPDSIRHAGTSEAAKRAAPSLEPNEGPVRERFRLLASDGSLCKVASAESFCSGFRQLLEAARSRDDVERLRTNNTGVFEILRARSDLRTQRGEHYADVLQRLIAARAKALVPFVPVATPPGAAHEKSESPAPPSLPHAVNALESANEGLSGPAEVEPSDRRRTGRKNAYGPFVPAPLYPIGPIAERILRRSRNEPAEIAQSEPVVAGNPSPTKAIVAAKPANAEKTAAAPLPTRRSRITGGYSIDKSVFALPSERRLRSKAHLALVASRPCLVCESLPCHAHHVTFAQARGLSLKVSDEFTVPLCVVHHNALHAAGNEASWWRTQGIEPLDHAQALWLATNGSETNASADVNPNSGAERAAKS